MSGSGTDSNVMVTLAFLVALMNKLVEQNVLKDGDAREVVDAALTNVESLGVQHEYVNEARRMLEKAFDAGKETKP